MEEGKWAVEMLATLHEINQKLGFTLQALENLAFPLQMMGETTPQSPNEMPESLAIDEPVLVKTLDGGEATIAMTFIESRNPKTAKAIRIARALAEPFQAYIMESDGVGIIVGDNTKAHIERLRSQGQWA